MSRPSRRQSRLFPLGTALACLMATAGEGANPSLPTGQVVIDGRVGVTVELARTPREREIGLSGRPDLPQGRGMLFVFDRPEPVTIWMKDMRFPIDILWIEGGRIVQIQRSAKPPRPDGPIEAYSAPAALVLEVPAGFAEQERIRVGHRVEVAVGR